MDGTVSCPIENPKASQYTLAMQRIVPLGLPSLAQRGKLPDLTRRHEVPRTPSGRPRAHVAGRELSEVLLKGSPWPRSSPLTEGSTAR